MFFKALFFIFLFFCSYGHSQSLNWSQFLDSTLTFSSPRAVDLNMDGVLDIVMGSGIDSVGTDKGIVALDGNSGNLLWSTPSINDIFSSATFNDINGDSIPEIYIGGREAQFYCINGLDGTIVWQFFSPPNLINNTDSGYYNFYSSQILDDVNNDGVKDVLVANGGDHSLLPWVTDRPPGHLMVLDGLNGNIISKAVVPDSNETYMSPIISELRNDNNYWIIYGTGGESTAGNLWSVNLNDLLNNDITNSTLLASSNSRGFIAPVNIVDLNNDSILDIVSQCQDGTIYSFDGVDFSNIWTFADFNNICESSISSAIGNFTGDVTPDVFAVLNKGVAPSYVDHYQVLIDGATGQLSWSDSIGDIHFASPSAFDYNLDGRDEVIISVNNYDNQLGYYIHELFVLDFQNDTLFHLIQPESGVNVTSTPYIGDLDNDSLIDIVYSVRVDSINPFNPIGINIKRINTPFVVSPVGVAWGSYMGSDYNGYYNYEGIACDSNFLFQSHINSCVDLGQGSIHVNVSQNNYTPYNYLWSTGSIDTVINNLYPGNYSLRVTDAVGCFEDYNISLNQPYFLYTQELVSNQCLGDSIAQIQVASNGCVCMFSNCEFYWLSGTDTLSNNHTLNNVSSGFYEYVVIHTDGCVISDSVFVNDGHPVISSYVIDSISCYGFSDGSIHLQPTDSLNTNYNWSNSDTVQYIYNLDTGFYYVITDNIFCSDSLFFSINQPDSVILFNSYNNLNCFNDSSGNISITVSGGTPNYNFIFSNQTFLIDSGVFVSNVNFQNLDTGNYYFNLYDNNGCYVDFDFYLNSPDELTLNIVAPLVPPNNGIIADVYGGLGPYNYIWSTGDTSESITPTNNGLYWCIVTDYNGCVSDTSFFNVNWVINSLLELDLEQAVIYPNPSYGKFNLHLKRYFSSICLVSYDNKIIYLNQDFKKGDNIIDVSYLNSGVYFIKLTDGERVYYEKLIIL